MSDGYAICLPASHPYEVAQATVAKYMPKTRKPPS
jgi:hypothetical protein